MKSIKHLVILFFITACGPVYQTDYQIVPPQDNMGRMCANNCLLSMQNCQQTCRIEESHCTERARLMERNEYLEYVTVQTASGKPVKRNAPTARRYYDCSQDACYGSCTNSYHICHTNCGGQIVPHTYCTAFCEQ
jgi:hypothetical protein